MKFFYTLFNSIQIWLYRATRGRLGGSMMGFNVLLLHTVGRKSGKERVTPLGYFRQDGGYLLAASNAGRPKHPAWYLNLMNSPRTKVEIMGQTIPVTAETLSGEARAQGWQQVISSAPQYARYEKMTTRQLPVIFLKPDATP